MELKKTTKADLENKKFTWRLIGYITVLACMFIAFEWTERDTKIDLSIAGLDAVFEGDMVPITRQEPTPPPPPEAAPVSPEILTVVDNTNPVEGKVVAGTENLGEAMPVKYTPIEETEETKPAETEIFVVAEDMPKFGDGSSSAIMKYFANNIKYPQMAIETGAQGTVIIQFVVNTDGSITDVQVVRSRDPYLDKEAVRVVSAMPKWTPGKQRGKAVRVKMTVPVTFKLQ
jgi:protein TonB